MLEALKTTRPLPPDGDVGRELLASIDTHPAVIRDAKELAAAREKLAAERGRPCRSPATDFAERRVIAAVDALEHTRAWAWRCGPQRRLPAGFDAAVDVWPYRRGGAPWVWRCDLLVALPEWSSAAVHESLRRLEAEGVIEGDGGKPCKRALALRLTARGLQLDDLLETLHNTPDAVGVVVEALDAAGGAS